MLPLLQKLKKSGKSAREKIVEEQPLQPVMPTLPPPQMTEADLKKSIAAKLQKYKPVDKDANFTGPRYFN